METLNELLGELAMHGEEASILAGGQSLVPLINLRMAAEMPDIEVDHIETPTATSELGTKGAGEAGTAGAMGAVLGAINDALSPFDARISETPCTPDRILRALGKI